jgi:hypothetical protein
MKIHFNSLIIFLIIFLYTLYTILPSSPSPFPLDFPLSFSSFPPLLPFSLAFSRSFHSSSSLSARKRPPFLSSTPPALVTTPALVPTTPVPAFLSPSPALLKEMKFNKINGYYSYGKILFTFNYDLDIFKADWNKIILPLMVDNNLYSFLFSAISDDHDNSTFNIKYHILSNSLRLSLSSNLDSLHEHLKLSYTILYSNYHISYTSHMLIYYKIWLTDVSPIQHSIANKHLAKLTHKLLKPSPVALYRLGDNLPLPFGLNYSLPSFLLPNNEYLSIEPLNLNVYKIFKYNFLNVPILEVIDTLNPVLDEVVRSYPSFNLTQVFNNNHIITSKPLSLPYLEQAPTDVEEFNNFITMDFETFGETNGLGIHTVFSCGFYFNNTDFKLYYLSDFPDSDSMIAQMFLDICLFKYRGSTIYFHNFSGFDAMFIVRGILKAGFNEPKIIDNLGSIKEMRITKKIKGTVYTFVILDSYLMLNSSLSNLAKDFDVTLKGVFPYKFVTKYNLSYIGPTPDIKYFTNISPEIYQGLISANWSMRINTLEYLHNDLLALHEVLLKFSTLIYDLTALNITKIKVKVKLSIQVNLSNSSRGIIHQSRL